MLTKLLSLFHNHRLACLLTLFGLHLGLGYLSQQKAATPLSMDYYTQQLSDAIQKEENEVMNVFFNGSFILNAIQNSYSLDTLKAYEKKPYTLLIFDQSDSLIYWNNNRAELYKGDNIKADTFIHQSYRLQNSDYYLIKAPYKPVLNGQSLNYTLVALIPIHEQYNINNEYLQNKFSLMPADWSNYVQVSDQPTPFYAKGKNKLPLVYLKAKDGALLKSWASWSMYFYLSALVFALFSLYLIAARLSFIKGLGLILGGLLLGRWLSYVYKFPLVAKSFELFNPTFSRSLHLWSDSLGEFILEVSLLIFVAIFVHRELRLAHFRPLNNSFRWQYVGFVYALIYVEIAALVLLVDNIITNSFISFRFDNVSEIEINSFITVGGLTGLFVAMLISNFRLLGLLQQFGFEFKRRAIIFVSVLGIGGLLTIAVGMSWQEVLIACVFSTLFTVLLAFFARSKAINLVWITLWLLWFAIFSTVVFRLTNLNKNNSDKQQFLQALSAERDPYLEDNFGTIDSLVRNDDFFNTFFSTGFISRKQTIDRLKFKYLDNIFFGRYDYNLAVFASDSSTHRSEFRDFSEFTFFINKSQVCSSPNLFFYSENERRHLYYAKIEIRNNNKLQGFFVIEFIPKPVANRNNILVEVLKMRRSPQEKLTDTYQYALFKNDKKVFSWLDNSPSFLPYSMPTPQGGKFAEISFERDNYLAYRNPNNNNLAIILIPDAYFWHNFTLFAYIFCTALAVFAFIMVLFWLWYKLFNFNLLSLGVEISLRERIQTGIVLVSFCSFLVIAVITIIYFRNEYNSYHQDNIKDRIKDAAKFASLKTQTQFDNKSPYPRALELAELIQLDVSLYQLNGQFISSSSENVFEQKLVSRNINPIALHKFRNLQEQEFILSEQIGNFTYFSAYLLLKDDCNEPLAYINLSYDSEAGNTNRAKEVAQFLAALLNVYVFFLLLAGAAALFIARTVTRPLTIIADKLKSVRLSRKNEPLEWKINDELGSLVSKYNQMLVDLERSKDELERTQRESAWRDMAKQVAHEIKNPLTPMKLGIQFLQKLFYLDPEKAKAKLEKTVQDILLQIDNLSHIASEFSNFAKMPTAQNEKFDILAVCKAVFQLFESEQSEQLNLVLSLPQGESYVWADKNQLLRVLNNLFKNAIQAIPDQQQGEISLSAQCLSDKIIISISDNGCGIPAEMRKNIFVPNFTTKSSGSGIGLAMCKNIIEASKGKIYFDENPSGGTIFRVELPLYG